VLIAKKEYSAENYKEMGKKFIADYYEHYKPFNDLVVIGLETKDKLSLSDGSTYHIRIDRLACDNGGNYYICDYKTNSSLKQQEELDEDKQLAMYSIWVKQKYPDAKSVKLVWFFLAFDKKMISERSEEQLKKLKQETEALIKEIEACQDFPVNVSSLCDYCPYMSICPAWKHKFEVEEQKKLFPGFKDDDGVRMVDELTELNNTKKEIEKRIDELKQNLINFAQQKEVSVVFGTNYKCSVKEYNAVVFPEDPRDKEELIKKIKDKGLYEQFSSLNYPKLSSKILKKEIDEEIIALTNIKKDYRLSLSKRKEK